MHCCHIEGTANWLPNRQHKVISNLLLYPPFIPNYPWETTETTGLYPVRWIFGTRTDCQSHLAIPSWQTSIPWHQGNENCLPVCRFSLRISQVKLAAVFLAKWYTALCCTWMKFTKSSFQVLKSWRWSSLFGCQRVSTMNIGGRQNRRTNSVVGPGTKHWKAPFGAYTRT